MIKLLIGSLIFKTQKMYKDEGLWWTIGGVFIWWLVATSAAVVLFFSLYGLWELWFYSWQWGLIVTSLTVVPALTALFIFFVAVGDSIGQNQKKVNDVY